MEILIMASLVASNTGVPEKLHSMMSALRSIGHNPRLIPLSPLFEEHAEIEDFLVPQAQELIKIYSSPPSWTTRLKRMIILNRLIRSSSPDIILYRYEPDPIALFALLLSRRPFVTEHNSKEIDEFRSGRKSRLLRRERFFGPITRHLTKGFVAVTPEILEHERARLGYNKAGIVISNSIDLSKYPRNKRYPMKSRKAVFLSNFQYWQGFDRVFDLFRRLNDMELLIIGSNAKTEIEESVAKDPLLSTRVKFLGERYGEELEEILLSCDLGISSLGIHRKGLRQACPLKARHYLALGLPLVIGYDDVDLRDDLPFVMKVPSDETPIDCKAFLTFYETVTSDHNICLNAREFAEHHLSVLRKMEDLSSFLESLCMRTSCPSRPNPRAHPEEDA